MINCLGTWKVQWMILPSKLAMLVVIREVYSFIRLITPKTYLGSSCHLIWSLISISSRRSLVFQRQRELSSYQLVFSSPISMRNTFNLKESRCTTSGFMFSHLDRRSGWAWAWRNYWNQLLNSTKIRYLQPRIMALAGLKFPTTSTQQMSGTLHWNRSPLMRRWLTILCKYSTQCLNLTIKCRGARALRVICRWLIPSKH